MEEGSHWMYFFMGHRSWRSKQDSEETIKAFNRDSIKRY